MFDFGSVTLYRENTTRVPERQQERRDSMEKLLLTCKDVMELTGYGRTSIYELLRTGELQVVRKGRSVRVPRASLDEWIEKQLAIKA